MGRQRVPSVTKAAAIAQIAPDAPIILFMGGPGGGKTKYAARIRDALEDRGLVHICVPDLIKEAISRYKDRFSEWREAARRYERGELIPNDLAQQLVKAEMGRYPHARAYFLEGFPREARQVEDFERNVRSVNMAMILDYDEDTLRKHMTARGLSAEVIDRRITEFRMKTLPSAKYFDDHRLLHLIPGEKDENTIFERMEKLTTRALESGVQPVPGQAPTTAQQAASTASNSNSQSPPIDESRPAAVGNAVESTAANEVPTSAQPTSPLTLLNAPVESRVETAASATSPTGPPLTQTDLVGRPDGGVQSEVPTKSKSTPPGRRSRPGTVGSSAPSEVARNAQPRSSTAGKSDTTMQHATTTSAGRTESSKRLSRSNSQVPAAPRESNVAPENEPSVLSRQTSSSRTGTRDGRATKPPTPQGSRPATQTSKRSSSKDVDSRPQTEQPLAERPPSSTASTPKPTSAGFEVTPSRLPVSPTATRIPTATERFPKGLPNNAPVVLVIGAPGSNKTEVAGRIARKYEGFVHLSMGELLRKKVEQNAGDELWSRVGKKMDGGEAIPMICRDVLYSAIHETGARCWGYVIEGYPRSLAQAEDIEVQLGRLDIAVLLDCTEQFCRDNLRKRMEASREHGESERPDDEENAAKQRLNLFKQNTLPMLKHLDDMGKLQVVEGDNGAERLYQDVVRLLDETVFIKEERTPAEPIDRPSAKTPAT